MSCRLTWVVGKTVALAVWATSTLSVVATQLITGKVAPAIKSLYAYGWLVAKVIRAAVFVTLAELLATDSLLPVTYLYPS